MQDTITLTPAHTLHNAIKVLALTHTRTLTITLALTLTLTLARALTLTPPLPSLLTIVRGMAQNWFEVKVPSPFTLIVRRPKLARQPTTRNAHR